MKKGFLLTAVLVAWFIIKNQQSIQLSASNHNSINKKAALLAKHVQEEFLSFTIVHLSRIKIKTNSCKQSINTKPLQACRKAQCINHETLLTLNSL
jgi:hypothetical protein